MEVVTLLLERGADVNTTDKDEWTALMYAAAKGQTSVVRVLIEHDADTTEEDSTGVSARMQRERDHTSVRNS